MNKLLKVLKKRVFLGPEKNLEGNCPSSSTVRADGVGHAFSLSQPLPSPGLPTTLAKQQGSPDTVRSPSNRQTGTAGTHSGCRRSEHHRPRERPRGSSCRCGCCGPASAAANQLAVCSHCVSGGEHVNEHRTWSHPDGCGPAEHKLGWS